jgi:hypothetical protein
MNIALRPSGGRGEYELAGRQGDLHVADVFGLAMFIEILPGVTINAHSHCVLRDGKPRIRLTQPARNAHPASLIAAALMLPKPRRERHETHGVNLLQWEKFVVQTIRIDVMPHDAVVVIRPVTVRLENADNVRLDISFAERMERVVRVWTAAATQDGDIAEAVRAHATAFTSANSSQAELTSAFTSLHSALGRPESDMLPLLEAHFGLGLLNASGIGDMSARLGDEDFTEETYVDPAAARVERAREWRLAAVRGSSAGSFRRQVIMAYDSRCMFSGERLPRTDATRSAGVDAAHILPWSRFDLDSTMNGLCLNKQSHWAFDVGLFRLHFDARENVYVVSIPNEVRTAGTRANFDLESFEALAGPIARDRLPANEALWPSPQYLGELNRFIDGAAD